MCGSVILSLPRKKFKLGTKAWSRDALKTLGMIHQTSSILIELISQKNGSISLETNSQVISP